MALPTRADAVAYLRLNPALSTGTPGDPGLAAEATFLDRLLAEATALVERVLGVPIVAVPRTMTVEVGDRPLAGSWPWGAWRTSARALFLPLFPVAASPAPVIVDQDGVTVDAATYAVDLPTGRVLAAGDAYYFVAGTYTVTATVGMSAASDYATAIEPVLSGAILDVVADRYQNREPGYSSVSDGPISRTHFRDGLPPRAAEALASFRRVRV